MAAGMHITRGSGSLLMFIGSSCGQSGAERIRKQYTIPMPNEVAEQEFSLWHPMAS
jgi:hypothetical protein